MYDTHLNTVTQALYFRRYSKGKYVLLSNAEKH